MIGANIDWHRFGMKENDLVITLAGTRDTWTPVCLARAGLIVREPIGIQK